MNDPGNHENNARDAPLTESPDFYRFVDGLWHCTQIEVLENGLVVKSTYTAEFDADARSSRSFGRLQTLLEDTETVVAELYVEVESQFEIDEEDATMESIGTVVELKVVRDDLEMLTPEFLEDFQARCQIKSKLIHVSSRNLIMPK